MTDQELLDRRMKWAASFDKNCISHWFPIIQAAGIHVPETIIVRAEEELTPWAYGEPPACVNSFAQQVMEAADTIGYPCFLRSGQTSAKHSWRETCFLADRNEVGPQMYRIAEFAAMVDLPTTCFAIRKLIPTSPVFTAFHGHMPITREFRFFVLDGETIHWQPYWPPAAVEEGRPSSTRWREQIEVMNRFEGGEYVSLSTQSERIGKQIGGYWSIDWLQSSDGDWFCTDMAVGDASYMWNPKTGKEMDAREFRIGIEDLNAS